jgi:hypothetical protein
MTSLARFDGAVIRLYGGDVLVVIVAPHVLADLAESRLLVAAFHARFRRTIVLAARDAEGRPTYFGPAAIARVLAAIPFEALSWRRYFLGPPPGQLPTFREAPTTSGVPGSRSESDMSAVTRSHRGRPRIEATRALRK